MARIPSDSEIFAELEEALRDLGNLPRRQSRRLSRFLTAFIHSRRMDLSQVGESVAEQMRGELRNLHFMRDLADSIADGSFDARLVISGKTQETGGSDDGQPDDLADG